MQPSNSQQQPHNTVIVESNPPDSFSLEDSHFAKLVMLIVINRDLQTAPSNNNNAPLALQKDAAIVKKIKDIIASRTLRITPEEYAFIDLNHHSKLIKALTSDSWVQYFAHRIFTISSVLVFTIKYELPVKVIAIPFLLLMIGYNALCIWAFNQQRNYQLNHMSFTLKAINNSSLKAEPQFKKLSDILDRKVKINPIKIQFGLGLGLLFKHGSVMGVLGLMYYRNALSESKPITKETIFSIISLLIYDLSTATPIIKNLETYHGELLTRGCVNYTLAVLKKLSAQLFDTPEKPSSPPNSPAPTVPASLISITNMSEWKRRRQPAGNQPQPG